LTIALTESGPGAARAALAAAGAEADRELAFWTAELDYRAGNYAALDGRNEELRSLRIPVEPVLPDRPEWNTGAQERGEEKAVGEPVATAVRACAASAPYDPCRGSCG